MKKRFRLSLALLMTLLVTITACSSSDDDDDNDQADDDQADDDDSTDDDIGDDDDDDDLSDDDDTAPHPYTPCCDVAAEALNLSDAGLSADGDGQYLYVQQTRTFVDAEREREIDADVFLPSSDGLTPTDNGGPFGVVLVVHGFSGTRAMVREYARRLATWGYIAIAPQLPYTSPVALLKISHTESTKDLLFILNTVCCEHEQSDSVFFGRVDRARLGAVGHSMGGKLSVNAALLDGALGAVAGLDPVDGAGPIPVGPDDPDFPDLTPDRVGALTIPTLYLGGEVSGTPVLGQACAPTEENYHEFFTYSPSPSVEVKFIGADHTDFVAQFPLDPCNIGTADHARVKRLAKKYAVSFLNYHLRGWSRFADEFAGSGIDADQTAGDVTWQRK
ncbi:MAG TPA: dienelactone hydrolase family protein [bacterium]|nr:dienelactone hydrolase family protein [bacterium]